jgi:hypothetical protein
VQNDETRKLRRYWIWPRIGSFVDEIADVPVLGRCSGVRVVSVSVVLSFGLLGPVSGGCSGLGWASAAGDEWASAEALGGKCERKGERALALFCVGSV